MGAVAAGGVMVNGAEKMDRGEAMMNDAIAQHQASLPPPPPPVDPGGPNMSIQPNMSMSDGSMSHSGTPVVHVTNQAGGGDYAGYGGSY